jgi:hypothetical protein
MSKIFKSRIELLKWPNDFIGEICGDNIQRYSQFGCIEWDAEKQIVKVNNSTIFIQKQTRLEFLFETEYFLSDENRPDEEEWMTWIRKTEKDIAAFISDEANKRNQSIVSFEANEDEVKLHYLLDEIFSSAF